MIIIDPALVPGTGLDLTSVWLNNAADLSDYQSFSYAGDSLTFTGTARAEIRQLVSRTRLIAQGVVSALGGGAVPDSAESLAVTFPECRPEQVAWLRSHRATTLCVRDHVGNKVYAAYTTTPRVIETTYRSPSATQIITSVSLTFEQVTYPEAA